MLRSICFLATFASCTLCLAGDDGLGRWYPPGSGRQIGKYNWPYSYHTSAVPQRPGHGYFPTYWRDWHENAQAIFSEPEHTILPKRERKKKEKPAETLPEPKESEEEEENAPAPPSEVEVPPSEEPEMPSGGVELPSGETTEPATTPESQTAEPSVPQPETPTEPTEQAPATAPENAPSSPSGESASELPMPLSPAAPAAPEEAPPAAEPPMSPMNEESPAAPTEPNQTEGPSLFRPQPRPRSLARQASALMPARRTVSESRTLQALGSGFSVPSSSTQQDQKQQPGQWRSIAPRSDGANSSPKQRTVAAVVSPRSDLRANRQSPSNQTVLRASFVEPVGNGKETNGSKTKRSQPVAVVRINQGHGTQVEVLDSARARSSEDEQNPLRTSASGIDNGWKPAKVNPYR